MKLDWEKQAEEYDQIWDIRHQEPHIIESWVENDWAKGRTEYLSFLVKVEDRSITEKISQIQSEIAEFQCIETFPREYLHLTIKETGCFLVPEKTEEDEFTIEEISRVISEADRIFGRFNPIELRLENLNNFISAVVVQAHDGGAVREINGALLGIQGLQKLRYDYPRFLPHLSFAQYKNEIDYKKFITYLEQNRETKVGPLKIDTIQLVIAHLPVKGRFPLLETLEEFKL